MSPGGSVFAVVAVTLLIAHTVADHWIQTGRQARDKGAPGWCGRWACAAHVGTYTLTTGAAARHVGETSEDFIERSLEKGHQPDAIAYPQEASTHDQ